MTVAFQRMFGILERWNNNQVTPSLSKPHELSYRSNITWLLPSDPFVCGLYPDVVSCLTLKSLFRCRINLLTDPPRLSVRMHLSASYFLKRWVATAWAIVTALVPEMGTAMQYLLKLSYIVKMCRFPFGVVGSLATVSRETFLKAPEGFSALNMGSRVTDRTNFCSYQLLQLRMYSQNSSYIRAF